MDSSNPFNLPAFSVGGLTPEQRANLEAAVAAGESSGGPVGLTPGEVAALDLADSTQPRSRVAGRGDSWARIARQEYGDERYALALAQANGARSSILRLGAEVQLPDLNGANLRQGGAFIAADAAMRAPTQAVAAGVTSADPRTVVTTDGITLGDLQTLNAAFARDAASTSFVGPREQTRITGTITGLPERGLLTSVAGAVIGQPAAFLRQAVGDLPINPITNELENFNGADRKLLAVMGFIPLPITKATAVESVVAREAAALQRIGANNRTGTYWADLREAYQQSRGQIDFAHIEADVAFKANGQVKAAGGHFYNSPMIDIVQGTETVGSNGVVRAQVNLLGPDGNWYLKNNSAGGISSLTPSNWSTAQAKGEMSQAWLNRAQTSNGWQGISSSGVKFQFNPPPVGHPTITQWRGYPLQAP
ncbi:MAG: EndoU domain-containing protein [Burkholderiaceae bacterium]